MVPLEGPELNIDDDRLDFIKTSSLRFSDLVIEHGANRDAQRPVTLDIKTCDETNAETDDAVSISVGHDGTREVFELDNPGDDRERTNQPDSYLLDEFGMRKINSLSIRKTGNNDWCIQYARLFVGGVKIGELPKTWLRGETQTLVNWNVNRTVGGATTGSAHVGFPFKASPGWYGSDPDRSIRVMSMNIRVGACIGDRHERQAKLVAREGVDILGTQEHDGDTINGFVKALTATGKRYAHSYGSIPHPSGKTRWFQPIFWNEDRFTLITQGTFPLPRGTGAACEGQSNRGVRWVELHDRLNGSSIVVYNTHLDHKCQRPAQAQTLVEMMRVEGHDKMPFVLMGDMNAPPGTPEINWYMGDAAGQAGLDAGTPLDTATWNAKNDGTVQTWGAGPTAGHAIDYILHNAKLTASDGQIISARAPGEPSSETCTSSVGSGLSSIKMNGQYSDHKPIVTNLRFH
jgi:endonuclease/exonuclease/phosphatase family metal-dependent hydrolase